MPRLLIVNPNTTAAVTEQMLGQARAVLPADAEVQAVTAGFGARYISSEASAAVAANAVLHACADAVASAGRPDAVLIGCFGDPGLLALRELLDVPVTGLAEASLLAGARHGSCAIVTGGAAWAPMLRRLAWSLDLLHVLTDIVTVERTGSELKADPQAAHALLLAACREAAARGQPGSIVLGGAALTGMGDALAPLLGLPLLDSVECGLRHAWSLACGELRPPAAVPQAAPAWTGQSVDLERLRPPR
jgi:Asp/Glu/hydantoin racemase